MPWNVGFRCAQPDLQRRSRCSGHHKLKIADDKLEREALEWSMTRGGRSGRVAWQFIQDLAGRLEQTLEV